MVEIFTKDACMQCDMSKKAFRKYQIEYVERPIEELKDQNYLGYAQAPIVVTPQGHWSGFRPDKIKALV